MARKTTGYLIPAASVCALACLSALAWGLATAPSLALGLNRESEPHGNSRLICLNEAETREIVKSRHLIEPFTALKSAAALRKAEAIRAKLCHAGDEFVYEITLLHRDGRLVRVQMDAASGKLTPLRSMR
jgi:hypothetical protein